MYIKPPTQSKLFSDTYLKLLKPLYVFSEYGDSWFQKYNNFLKQYSKLSATYGNPSFHYKTGKHNNTLKVTLHVYVYDTPAPGKNQFLKLKDKISETFESNPQ